MVIDPKLVVATAVGVIALGEIPGGVVVPITLDKGVTLDCGDFSSRASVLIVLEGFSVTIGASDARTES